MSESLIRHLYASIDMADWDALARCFRPDGVYERSGAAPLVGVDRVLRFYREERGVAQSRHTIEGVLADGRRATAWGRMDGVRDSGEPVAIVFADVYDLAEGGIQRRRSYFYA